MEIATLHVWVSGRVQGVFFRESTRRMAAGLGLTGWVRNLADGRVEAVFQGERDACEQALEFVNAGPDYAQVDDVHAVWQDDEEVLNGFELRY